ncbi:MAG: phosphate regulon sensor histidine kinase PhoR [Nitrococcus sp.]|nr:phosphate regulon sensor histidine kinase PhoR [Nitrococcus sp.]
MIHGNPWPRALVRWALSAGVLALAGAAAGQLVLFLFLGTLACLLWQLRNVIRLENWLRKNHGFKPPDSRGLWGGIFGALYKMQRRRRARLQRLRTILHAFRESIDAVPDGVVALREPREMQWWNDAAERLLGIRWPQDRGQRLDNLYRNPDFAEFIGDSPDETRQVTLPSPVDEQIMLEIRVVPYGREQRLLIARDVSRLHKLERMRRDFVANISHELRSPLTVVHGLAETLAEQDAESATDQRRMLGLVQQQTRRMARLVEDLLLLSRLETTRRPTTPKQVDVPALLRGLCDEAKAANAEREHDIRLEIIDECSLRADEAELRSAFSNLLFNAINYTPQKGSITLRWWCDAAGAHFCVADTGIGIAPEHIPRLTERFYRVDRGRSAKTGGTGLGLAIVKHILQHYGARLGIESRPGLGSTFCCHFPAETVCLHRNG